VCTILYNTIGILLAIAADGDMGFRRVFFFFFFFFFSFSFLLKELFIVCCGSLPISHHCHVSVGIVFAGSRVACVGIFVGIIYDVGWGWGWYGIELGRAQVGALPTLGNVLYYGKSYGSPIPLWEGVYWFFLNKK